MLHVGRTLFMVSAYNCAFIFHSLCIYHCFKSGDQPPILQIIKQNKNCLDVKLEIFNDMMSGAMLGITDKMEAWPQPSRLISQARSQDGVRPCDSNISLLSYKMKRKITLSCRVVRNKWDNASYVFSMASLVSQTVKNPPAIQETQFRSLGWKIPRRREWQPTPLFLPGKSHEQRSLAATVHGGHSQTQLSN